MTYEKQTWVDGSLGGTPIDKAALDHIEQGIFDIDAGSLAAGVVTANFPTPGDNYRYVVPGWRTTVGSAVGDPLGQGLLNVDLMFLVPIYVSPAMAFDRIAVNILGSVHPGGLVRLGLFDDAGVETPTGPTAVLADGTVASDSAGLKELTIAVTLSGWNWLAINSNSACSSSRLPKPVPPFSSRLAPDFGGVLVGGYVSVPSTDPLTASPILGGAIEVGNSPIAASLRMA